MRHLKLSRWVVVLMLAFALAPSTASAQGADTLSVSGTFHMDELWGTIVGVELAEVFANDNDHEWSLTLYRVTYSYDDYSYEWHDESGYGYVTELFTLVHATSFDFHFFGPDADVLNEVVSQQLIGGGASLGLLNGDSFDPLDPFGGGLYSSWSLQLYGTAGVSFSAGNGRLWPQFSTDEYGYPVVEPQSVTSERTFITDLRPGNSGSLVSVGDVVDIGSPGPPDLPPPPGDFNHDGTVDAADYVVWRKGLGTIYTQDPYNVWRAHFGQTAGSGAALPSANPPSAAVPEPATAVLFSIGLVGLSVASRRRVRRNIVTAGN